MRRVGDEADESDLSIHVLGPVAGAMLKAQASSRRQASLSNRWSCRQNLTVLWAISMWPIGPSSRAAIMTS